MRLVACACSALLALFAACGDDGGGDTGPGPLPAPSCMADGGSQTIAMPVVVATLADRFEEAWLGSAAVADLDGNGSIEIVVPRHDRLLAWNVDGAAGALAWITDLPGRIWASPVVADLVASRPGLEVAVASRDQIVAYGANGEVLPGFPVTWRDEMRSLAAADIDGNGSIELVAVTTTPLEANGQRDIVFAVHGDGSTVAGFPPNTSGASGCDDACYVTGGYDQNIALGDVDGDGHADLFQTQDNAYMSLHDGAGRAFDAAPIFQNRTKFSGIRWMVDYTLAQQGYSDNEDVDEQAHFTNSAPAIADLDGDRRPELVVLGSIQNVAQTDRERGVAVFVARPDGTRPDAWTTPVKVPDYVGGLWDPGDNIVGITNQIAVAEIDPSRPGPELVFAGFDGRLHAVDASGRSIWTQQYATDSSQFTAGVAIADLSRDGIPELVMTTYGTSGGDLIVLDAGGNIVHRIVLGGRGAMPVPTIADADGDGDLDLIVSLKDAVDRMRSVLVFEVAGSSANCLLWTTGRGNMRRDGFVPPP